jgi:hypothetical protein
VEAQATASSSSPSSSSSKGKLLFCSSILLGAPYKFRWELSPVCNCKATNLTFKSDQNLPDKLDQTDYSAGKALAKAMVIKATYSVHNQ